MTRSWARSAPRAAARRAARAGRPRRRPARTGPRRSYAVQQLDEDPQRREDREQEGDGDKIHALSVRRPPYIPRAGWRSARTDLVQARPAQAAKRYPTPGSVRM